MLKKQEICKKNRLIEARTSIFLVLAILCIGSISAADWDNVADYTDDDKTVIITNWLGLGEELGRATLTSHTEVTDIRNVFPGDNRIVMYYEFSGWDLYENGLGEITFTDLNTDREVSRRYKYQVATYTEREEQLYDVVCEKEIVLPNGSSSIPCHYEESGSKTIRYISSWKDLEKADIPKGNVTIGIAVDVSHGDYIDGVWEIAGKKVTRHAGWQATLDDGLISYYSFENIEDGTTVRDVSNYGAANMNATTGDVAKANYSTIAHVGSYSYKWTDTTSLTSTGNVPVTGDSSSTLNLWVNFTVEGNPYLGGYSGNVGTNNAHREWYRTVALNRLSFAPRSNDANIVGIPVLENNWHMVTWLYDNATSNASVFVDGVYEGHIVLSDLATTAGVWKLGESLEAGAAGVFKGNMDELSFWNRRLTSSEIADLWNSGAGTTYTFPNTAPTITNNAPANHTNFSVRSVTINCTGSDDSKIANVSLYIDGTYNQTVFNYTADQTDLSLETTEEFSDGTYLYYCKADDADATILTGTGIEVTFHVDTTPPVLGNTWNMTTDVLTTASPINKTFNYSVSDTNLVNCWFNTSDDAAIQLNDCNIDTINATFSTGGVKQIYYYANDSGGLETYANKSFEYFYVQLSQNVNKQATIQGSSSQFNLTINYSAIPSTATALWYNGSSYSPTTAVSTNQHNSTRFLTIPTTVGNSTGQNASWFWEFKITGVGTLNTTTQLQNVKSFAMDNCSVETHILYNFTIRDEEDQFVLNGTNLNTSADLDINIYSIDRTTLLSSYSKHISNKTNPFQICTNTNLSTGEIYSLDLEMQYGADHYARESYNIQNDSFSIDDFVTQIILYDLINASMQEFKITYKDEQLLAVEDALIQIQRKYLSEGLFKTVEIPKTDYEGKAVGHLQIDDAIYTMIVTKNGRVLATFSNVIATCQNPILQTCEINLNSFSSHVPPGDYTTLDDFEFTLTYDDATRDISSVFVVPSGASTTVLINATLFDTLGKTEVCSDTLTSSSGTLTCNVPISFGNSSVIVRIYKDDELISSNSMRLAQQARDIYGNNIMFLGLILSLGFIGLAVNGNPMISGAILILGLLSGVAFSLINTGSSSYIGAGATVLWLIIGIIIIMVKGGNR